MYVSKKQCYLRLPVFAWCLEKYSRHMQGELLYCTANEEGKFVEIFTKPL